MVAMADKCYVKGVVKLRIRMRMQQCTRWLSERGWVLYSPPMDPPLGCHYRLLATIFNTIK